MAHQFLLGFHAINARLKHHPESVREVFVESNRKDIRIKNLIELAEKLSVRVIAADGVRMDGMSGGNRHQV